MGGAQGLVARAPPTAFDGACAHRRRRDLGNYDTLYVTWGTGAGRPGRRADAEAARSRTCTEGSREPCGTE